jgi:hypothetical protein
VGLRIVLQLIEALLSFFSTMKCYGTWIYNQHVEDRGEWLATMGRTGGDWLANICRNQGWMANKHGDDRGGWLANMWRTGGNFKQTYRGQG